MTELTLTARRVGDLESRTEEYELTFAAGRAERTLAVKYQAARAYEINAALDECVETVRDLLRDHDPNLAQPKDEALAQFSWRTLQAAKYEKGEPKSASMEL